MRLIIEARLEAESTDATATPTEYMIIAVVDRQDRSLGGLGLTLTKGRALLAEIQSVLVAQQADPGLGHSRQHEQWCWSYEYWTGQQYLWTSTSRWAERPFHVDREHDPGGDCRIAVQ